MKKLIGAAAAFSIALALASVTTDALGGGKAIEIKPEEFAKEWKANAGATQKKYNGKTVTFTGPVHGFSMTSRASPSSTFAANQAAVASHFRCEPRTPSPGRCMASDRSSR